MCKRKKIDNNNHKFYESDEDIHFAYIILCTKKLCDTNFKRNFVISWLYNGPGEHLFDVYMICT